MPQIEFHETKRGYDLWSEVYDGEANPLVALEEPRVDELLGCVAGLTALDVGCGTGRHSHRLAAAGAIVTGLDFSEGMLAKARQKRAARPINFVAHDLARPLPFGPATFDRVVCGLVVDHIADLPGLFGELGRVCRPDGSIVVSVMHPAMMLKGVQARFHDPKTGVEVRPASVPNRISDYVMGITKAGLRIVHLSEHEADEALVARAPRAGKYLGWPMLFMMQLQPA